MKKIFFLALFLCLGITANAQNQGTNLYLIFNINEPDVIKNVYKYVRNNIDNPRMQECGVFKTGTNGFCFSYPFYYGRDLKLIEKTVIQTITISQVASLYPQARTAVQLDLDMQPAIDYDYQYPIRNLRNLNDAKTIKYLKSFDKIVVIEYLPNGTAKVVECVIPIIH
jgi:hypothetical protein